MSKTHRRQTSHPVGNAHSSNIAGTGNGHDNTASVAAEMIVSNMLENTQNRMKAVGHRRSHSYGHHKGFHDNSNNQTR